jgi:hypothetical protein
VRERGVLYIVSSSAKSEAQRSIESLQRAGLDYCVKEVDEASNISAKANMFELSPFRETLFLDSDTIVLDDLDFGFEMAARHGLALSMASTCWARRQWTADPDARKRVAPELVEYDLGVMFFTRTPETRHLFESWRAVAGEYGTCERWSFSQVVYDTAYNPFVLSEGWNFRAKPITSGPIKIWHSRRQPPPHNIDDWNRGPVGLGVIENGCVTRAKWYPSTFRAAYPRA